MNEQTPLTGTLTTALSIGTISTSGMWTGGSTTYITPNTIGTLNEQEMKSLLDEIMENRKQATKTVPSITPVEMIEAVIEKLKTSDNELEQNAVKHLTVAKAYLDKLALQIINERI